MRYHSFRNFWGNPNFLTKVRGSFVQSGGKPYLETSRCILVTLQQSDYEDVKKIYTNHEVRRYLGGKIPEERTPDKFVDAVKHSYTDSLSWVVRLKDTYEFIGLVSLDKHIDGEKEVSYEFIPDWWGQGYAYEVIREVLVFAFNNLNLSKIIAETQKANDRSCRLLEKLGMHLEKTVERYGAEQAIYSIEKPLASISLLS